MIANFFTKIYEFFSTGISVHQYRLYNFVNANIQFPQHCYTIWTKPGYNFVNIQIQFHRIDKIIYQILAKSYTGTDEIVYQNFKFLSKDFYLDFHESYFHGDK